MRKLISLGLLALMFSVFSSQTFAEVEDCEEVKGAKKGLYGLCIAYWNTTNAKARAKILENFNKNDVDGLGMPGLDIPACDCWNEQHVLDAIEGGELNNYSCDANGASLEVANLYSNNSVTYFAFPDFCAFVHPEDAVFPTVYSSDETEYTCRAQIQEIIFEITGDECLE